MTRNQELKHAADIFDQMTDSYLQHDGVPGMEWYKNKAERYQPQAQYARFIPNPNGKVRGTNIEDAKKRMSVKHKPGPYVQKDKGMADYPIQKFSELKKLSGSANLKTRTEINHPSNEIFSGAGRHFNCPNCAAAFDMQERGYDVIARTAKNGSNVGDVEKLFKGGKLLQPFNTVTDDDISNLSKLYRTYSKIHFGKDRKERAFRDFDEALTAQQMKMAFSTERAIQAQGKGARGIIVVGWIDDPTFSERTTSYHAFNYKNEADGVKFYDAQSSKTEKLNGMSMSKAKNDFFLDISPQEVYLMRTDNIVPSERIMSSIYSPDRSKDLKHAAEDFDQLTDDFLVHYGTPGMHWRQQGPGKRYQSHAVYAQGKPNPDAKVRGQKETGQSNSKKVILDRDSFNALPNKKRIKMHTDAGLGKNKAFNKMMTDSLKQEKDGTHGIINTYGPRIKSAMMKYEVHDGKITYREALFGRKVSKKFANNILNQSIWGNYTRDTTPLKKGLFHAADICDELSEMYLQHSEQYLVDKTDNETNVIKHAADVFDQLTDKFLISMQTVR